jgi:phage/conjugal plasmid C-4 type zinc finger TraR family protein
MDEKYLEQAQAIEMAARTEAQYRSAKALTGTGQADCDDCGEAIPAARRLAAPAAIRCIQCQTLFERP